MAKNIFLKTCIDYYEELLRKALQNPTYEFRCNDKDFKIINSFLEYYKDSIGELFIKRFIDVQFAYYIALNTNFGKGRVFVSWIFGKAAFERYDAKLNWQRTKDIRKTLNKRITVSRKPITSSISDCLLSIRTDEENEKVKYLNTPKGLAWCASTTTLYFHKSENCLGCSNKENCKLTLKNNMPYLYRLRGYGQ